MDAPIRDESATAGNSVHIGHNRGGHHIHGHSIGHLTVNGHVNMYNTPSPKTQQVHAPPPGSFEAGNGTLSTYTPIPYRELLTQPSPDWAAKYEAGNLGLLGLKVGEFEGHRAPQAIPGYAPQPNFKRNNQEPSIPMATWTILSRIPGGKAKKIALEGMIKEWWGAQKKETQSFRSALTLNNAFAWEADPNATNPKVAGFWRIATLVEWSEARGVKAQNKIEREQKKQEEMRIAASKGIRTSEELEETIPDFAPKRKKAQKKQEERNNAASNGIGASEESGEAIPVRNGKRPGRRVVSSKSNIDISEPEVSDDRPSKRQRTYPGVPRSQPALIPRCTDRLLGSVMDAWNEGFDQEETGNFEPRDEVQEEKVEVEEPADRLKRQEQLRKEELEVKKYAEILLQLLQEALVVGFTREEADKMDEARRVEYQEMRSSKL